MSHTLTQPGDSLRFALLNIINYAVGGEQVLPSEVGAVTVDAVILGTVPPGSNSLNVPLFPILSGGKIMLFRFVAGAPVEIPATTALNAAVPCLIHISQYAIM